MVLSYNDLIMKSLKWGGKCIMNQVKHILSSLIEPLTKVETYETLAIKIIMILIYIIAAIIVISILNKVIEQAFKIQNKSRKGNKNVQKH